MVHLLRDFARDNFADDPVAPSDSYLSNAASAGFGSLGDGSGTSGSGTSSGVSIAGALSGSPAANAGLTEGDTITSVGGQTVSSATDIQQILVKYHPGDKVSISWVDQSGQTQTTTVTLASGPAA